MNETIKKRLAVLERLAAPKSIMVSVELPSGKIDKRSAHEWWEHRREWPLADFDKQTNEAGMVIFLVLAALADEACEKAEQAGNREEAERLAKERHDMLVSYFGEDVTP